MRQAVFRAALDLDVVERARPSLGPADARIAVEACGVCGSDVATYLHGHYVQPGQVMGHELSGTVLETGADVEHIAPGDRVVARPLRPCGICWHCRRGAGHLCGVSNADSMGYGADGGYADELVVLDEALHRQLVPLGPGVSLADGAWTEPLAVCLHALTRAEVGPGDRLLVVGAGPIGLAVVAAAREAGVVCAVVEPRGSRREAALAMGAEVAHDPSFPLPDGLVDAAIDASGVAGAIAAAALRVRPGGVLVLLGLGDDPLPAAPPGVRVRGSFAFVPAEFARSARLIAAGGLRLADAVTHRFGLADVAHAIEAAAHDPSAVKVVVRPAHDRIEAA